MEGKKKLNRERDAEFNSWDFFFFFQKGIGKRIRMYCYLVPENARIIIICRKFF